MAENKRYVVGLGEALWDKTLKKEVQEEAESKAAKAGQTLMEYIKSEKLFDDKKNYDKKPGGAPANFAYHAGQWLDDDNIKVLVVSSLGRDDDGKELNDILREKGLNEVPQLKGFKPSESGKALSELLQIENYKTGEVWITLDESGKPAYDIKEGAYDHIPYDEILVNGMTLKEIAKNCRAVCFGSLAQRNKDSRDTIQLFLKDTPDYCLKVFDINLRQNHYSKKTIKESLELCNILKINDEELVTFGQMFNLSHLKEPEDKCREILKEFELDMLILTCGEEGSYVFTKDLTSYQDTPVVKPGSTIGDVFLEDNFDKPKIAKKLHTVGAGDSFTGSFIAAIINSKTKIGDLDFDTIQRAHKLAVQVSAFVCTEEGAMPEIPNVIRKYNKRLKKEQETKNKKDE